MNIYIDIKSNAYISSEKIKTVGGLPVGTSGRALLLLSGGIDSPVAGYMMAKRGVEVDALYFHTYPFTSERANEKVKHLAELLEDYCGKIKLYSVNILEIHKAIKEHCREDQTTILARRFMMRIAERLANKNGIDMLITGESLGQVASQTMTSMVVIENSIDMPILKPVIGMDKTEIMEISRTIGTYETSILPYDDCCSVFAPKHPLIKPKLQVIQNAENNLDVEGLIEKALSTIEIL
jgi:thiamine biosynthesis protein ThiI